MRGQPAGPAPHQLAAAPPGLAACRAESGRGAGSGPGQRRRQLAAAPAARGCRLPTARCGRCCAPLQVKKAMTMTEKILAKHSDKPAVVPGDNVRQGSCAARSSLWGGLSDEISWVRGSDHELCSASMFTVAG